MKWGRWNETEITVMPACGHAAADRGLIDDHDNSHGVARPDGAERVGAAG